MARRFGCDWVSPVEDTLIEGQVGPADALRMVPFVQPVKIHLCRLARCEIPGSAQERTERLFDQWAIVVTCIARHRKD